MKVPLQKSKINPSMRKVLLIDGSPLFTQFLTDKFKSEQVALEYAESKRVLDVAIDISEGLARAACAGRVNGEVVDLRQELHDDCELEILTFNDEDGKKAYRHTASHILAQAVKRLYPDTKLAIGPAIEEGFYYDFDRETGFTQEDAEVLKEALKTLFENDASSARPEGSMEVCRLLRQKEMRAPL